MDHLLDSIGGRWEKATIKGEFMETGSIQGFPYPGVRLSDDGDEIEGYLFVSGNLSNHWDRIDAYEGIHYERVVTRAILADGRETDAYVYELKLTK